MEFYKLSITLLKEKDVTEIEVGETFEIIVKSETLSEIYNIKEKEEQLKEYFTKLVDKDGNIHNIDLDNVYGFQFSLYE